MKDRDIRQALRAYLVEFHRGESALILDELRLSQGNARVDLAVINGTLNGYEIKSEHDTLRRLPGQLEEYGKVFDRLALVVGPRYVDRVRQFLPPWCGLLVATQDGAGKVELTTIIEGSDNPSVAASIRVQLLWRDEALLILKNRGLDLGNRSKPRFKLWQALAASVPAHDLNDAVRLALKARGDWRSDRPRAPSGATS